jgi:hypothetical protein
VYFATVARNAMRELRDVLRASTTTHGRLRDRFAAVIVVTIVVDLISAVLALTFERHTSGTQIMSFGSALFWTSTQLLTVSSQLPNPVSTPGRVLDVAMEAYAITVVGSLAGAIGAFLVTRGHELDQSAEKTPVA